MMAEVCVTTPVANPTPTQWVASEQLRPKISAATLSGCDQVVPPFVVARMMPSAPAAKHSLVVGQLIV